MATKTIQIPLEPTPEILRGMAEATFLRDGSNLEMHRRYNGLLSALKASRKRPKKPTLTVMQLTDKLADWTMTQVCYAHDKVVTKEYRAFEKKYGPNGYFNFANYVLASKPWSILFHGKLPDDLFRFIYKRKKHQGGWLA